tara:strand:+ start:5730 stop:6431 length:702 start_codon:yes stop_codon:yes gene_type:complete
MNIQQYNDEMIKNNKCICEKKKNDYNKKMIQTNPYMIKKIKYKKSPLCKLAIKYNVDKCPDNYHYYTPEYYNVLKDFYPKSMLEIGIGYYDMMSKYTNSNYKKGASLYMWRDFFKDCKIYGCDILKECMFIDNNIETIICNQSKPKELQDMINLIGNQDLIIDDGSHINQHQFISFIVLWQYLNKDGIYIIEDVCKNLLHVIGNFENLFDDCKCIKKYSHENDIQGFVCFKKI